VTPRTGGEADKIGNRYERGWTTTCLIEVIGGEADWVRIEPLGELGKGAEFLLRRPDGIVEAHQVKRQRGLQNAWSVTALTALNVWAAARSHIDAGRDFHFVSTVAFRPLQELADRTRSSDSYESFVRGGLPAALQELFSQLGAPYGAPESVYETLRHFHVRHLDEIELQRRNAVLADALLDGGTSNGYRAALGEIIDNHIDTTLTAGKLLTLLQPYGFGPRTAGSRQGFTDRIRSTTATWLTRVGRQLIEPVIPRAAAERIHAHIAGPARVHFLVGAAGGGKSGVLHQAVTLLVADDVPTLTLRLDRHGPLTSTSDLGQQLQLGMSPVAALAAVANGRPAVLVVDQLDATSLASGRLPENFEIVADLVAEAAAIDQLHVVLGCRQFDLHNDDRIRLLRDRFEATVDVVAELTQEEIRQAVAAFGLPSEQLTIRQTEVLRLPLHLMLLGTVAGRPNALEFGSSQRLFEVYWSHKLRAVRDRKEQTRFAQVVERLTDVISARQELSVPVGLLDGDDLADDAEVLISEQFLVRDGARIAFFHEALFDYAFARGWVNRRQPLVDFLLAGEQELFRRGQVRQILVHLRGTEPERFLDEVDSVLMNPKVRFHLKDTCLAVLGDLSAPSSAEAAFVIAGAQTHPQFSARLWGRLRRPQWFARWNAEGQVVDWLEGDGVEQDRALQLMSVSAPVSGDQVAELLGRYRHTPNYHTWLRVVITAAALQNSTPLFELFIDAVNDGCYDDRPDELWWFLFDLRPAQIRTTLAAYLTGRRRSFELTADGRVIALDSREQLFPEIVTKAAAADPEEWLAAFLPYLLEVMRLTAVQPYADELPPDRHFSVRHPALDTDNDLGEVILESTAQSLRTLVKTDPAQMRPRLEQLAADRHATAQWLLYQGFIAAGEIYASWAGTVLLEGRHRLLCGDALSSVRTTQLLLRTISPHLTDEVHTHLEARLGDLRFEWERHGASASAFTLLSALDESRLTPAGARRLGEFRRYFDAQQPTEPEDMVGGWIGPPIADEAAARMSDDNWLQAMIRHGSEQTNYSAMTGGAREQAEVFRERVHNEPDRFARLASRFGKDINPVYGTALLMGLADAESADPTLVFDAVRRIATLGHRENDRWLGWALRRHRATAPLDIVELLLERLVRTSRPDDRTSSLGVPTSERRDALRLAGMNTVLGQLAESLADLLVEDVDGSRTALVAPHLQQLAADPSTQVRSCTARLILAAMRHQRVSASAAFWTLIDGQDELLASRDVVSLLLVAGAEAPRAISSTVRRMLGSELATVREAGGVVAAIAAIEWELDDYLAPVVAGTDISARTGAAGTAARRLPTAADAVVAGTILKLFFDDDAEPVRKSAAAVVGALRDKELRPHEDTVKALIASRTFDLVLTRLLRTLERAPDRVDDLVILCVERSTELVGTGQRPTRPAFLTDHYQLGRIVVRALAQTKSVEYRRTLLDALDALLASGAYGIDDLVTSSER
jgi:hypothetical protein